MTTADATEPAGSRLALLLDVAERITVAVLLLLLCGRLLAGYRATGEWLNLLLLASESAVVLFIIIRRQTNMVSLRPRDWVFAAVGTAGPLLVAPGGHGVLSQVTCGMILVFGLVLQLSAKFALRRSFGIVAANRGVKSSGPYRYLRHPMYAGYLICHLAFLLANLSLWNLVVYIIADGAQLFRIAAEERMLSQDEGYRALCRDVPWRLVPFVY